MVGDPQDCFTNPDMLQDGETTEERLEWSGQKHRQEIVFVIMKT